MKGPTVFKTVALDRSATPPGTSETQDSKGASRGGGGIRTHEEVVTPYGISSAAH